MVIRIIEKCTVESHGDGKTEGLRVIMYRAQASSLPEALNEFTHNFDFNLVIETDDNFDGECVDSKTISVTEDLELKENMFDELEVGMINRSLEYLHGESEGWEEKETLLFLKNVCNTFTKKINAIQGTLY